MTAQNLIRTAKGAAGGSYVTQPTVDHISAFVHADINLLTESGSVTLEELLEARDLLEVPAARLAAARRSGEDLERLRRAGPETPIAAQPIFSVLQTNLARSSLGRQFHKSINEHHVRIIEAIDAGDVDGAGEEMRSHLDDLRPWYERAWRHAVGRSA